nr:hypothetical protein [uncultured Mediterraneibacter sp.]
MLEHVEIIFEDMKPMMKKLKKKNYQTNMEEFLSRHGHYFQEMTAQTENAEDKDAVADELARVFAGSVEKAYISPKKGKIDPVVQLDLNFFMIYYVFPAILKTEHEDARLIADHLRDEWSRRFKDSDIQYTDYDSLYAAFREKIFGIL